MITSLPRNKTASDAIPFNVRLTLQMYNFFVSNQKKEKNFVEKL